MNGDDLLVNSTKKTLQFSLEMWNLSALLQVPVYNLLITLFIEIQIFINPIPVGLIFD